MAGAMLLLFCFLSTCCFAVSDGGRPQDSFAKGVYRSWCKPIKGIEVDMYPAISGKMCVCSEDIPLAVPLGPIMQAAAAATNWTIDILSQRGTVPFSARLVPAWLNGPAMVQVLHQKSAGHSKVVLVSIDDALTIWDAKGRVFGRLVQRPLQVG